MKIITLESKAASSDPLDMLASQAEAQQAGEALAAAPEGEAEAPGLSNAQCFAMAFEMVRDTLCSFAHVKTPKQTLSADKIQPAADALGAVADKYGINLAGAAGNYMVEIKAAMLTVPLLLAFRGGLMTEIKEMKALAATTPSDAAPAALAPGPVAVHPMAPLAS
jgi:hypothetical protein